MAPPLKKRKVLAGEGGDDGDLDSVDSSPTSVTQVHASLNNAHPLLDVEMSDQKRHSPPLPPPRKYVQFKRDRVSGKIREEFIESNFFAQEDMCALWSTKSELADTTQAATQVINEIKTRNPAYVQEVVRIFQECSRETNLQRIVSSHLPILLNPPSLELRGLERQVHQMLSKYRALHRHNVLEVQKNKLPTQSSDEIIRHQRILRSTSMNTSRVSRALAIVWAHGDAMQVAHMVREELASIPRDAASSDDSRKPSPVRRESTE
jgi:hypothetical protein